MSVAPQQGGGKTRPPSDPMRRHAARLAAVQALYQIQVAGTQTNQALAQFLAGGAELDSDEAVAPPLDAALLAELVRGVAARRSEIDELLTAALGSDKRLQRIEILLRCVLRAGTFELLAGEAQPDRAPARMVINEYMDITHAFFSGAEPALVNGVLDRLARTIRPGELEAKSQDRVAGEEAEGGRNGKLG